MSTLASCEWASLLFCLLGLSQAGMKEKIEEALAVGLDQPTHQLTVGSLIFERLS